MTDATPSTPVIAVTLALGALALGASVAFGWLGRRAFRRAPKRAAVLDLLDLIVAFGLLLVGMGTVVAIGGQFSESPMGQAVATVVSQVVFLGPAALFVVLRARTRRRGLAEFGLTTRSLPRDLGVALLALVFALPLVYATNLLGVLLGQALGAETPATGHVVLDMLTKSDDARVIGLFALGAIVVAPVLEEILYRGLIQTVLLGILGWPQRWKVILIAAVLFMLVHGSAAPWQAMLGLGVFGVVLGWLYERTGSLWPCILTHAGFNAVNVLIALSVEPPPTPAT